MEPNGGDFMIQAFRSSARNFRNIRALAAAGMLLAVQVVLGWVASIPVGPNIRISFGYLALSSAGALLGPAVAPINGALADLIGHFTKPTGPYIPGFTLTGVVRGLIYGFLLYRQDITLKRVLLTKLLIDLVCNILLNTLWLDIWYGKAFLAILPGRLLKNLFQYPVDILLAYPVLKKVCSLKRF